MAVYSASPKLSSSPLALTPTGMPRSPLGPHTADLGATRAVRWWNVVTISPTAGTGRKLEAVSGTLGQKSEETLESPLDSKENKSVNSKGNQP